MMSYQYSQFDSDLFAIKVARILPLRLNYAQLTSTLEDLRKEQYCMAIWISDSTDQESQKSAQSLGGFLGSEQLTYHMSLADLDLSKFSLERVEEYTEKTSNADLEHLANCAGTLSHFRNDKKLDQTKVTNLYNIWIANSVNGKIAKKVFIIRSEQKIAAMITCGEKNNCGDIGLLAVDENFRGQKMGEALVRRAQAFFIKEGYACSQVVTQLNNFTACKLYEKCGYRKQKVENYYHFWL